MLLEKEDDIKIYYETYGKKGNTPIVLIHGLGCDHNMYQPQIEKYTKKGYYLITPDMRGHGKSSKVKTLTLTDWTEDIYDLIEHLDLNKVVLLGISMGGVIAQKFITRYPEKVRKLILSDTFAELKSITEKFAGISQVLSFKFFKYLPNKFAASMFASAYKDFSDEVYDYFKKVTLAADFRQLELARKAINKIDVLDELKQVSIPVLVLVGNKADIMIKPAEKIVDKLKNVDFKIIEDALDPSNMTNTEVFDKYVLEFLKRDR